MRDGSKYLILEPDPVYARLKTSDFWMLVDRDQLDEIPFHVLGVNQ